MSVKRRIPPEDGLAAVDAWARAADQGPEQIAALPRAVRATAVRYTLEELATGAPGNAVEVRVPPYGVCQCLEGPGHTRGTPPNVIETDAATWLALATGRRRWSEAVDGGDVRASGARADLAAVLPLLRR